MKKLFLTSEGINPEIQKDFCELVGRDTAGLTVAMIPTAAKPEKDRSYIDRTITRLRNDLGMESEIVDIKDFDKESLYQKLQKFDVIFVHGGNTFYLLDGVKKSGFDQIINQLLDEGKVYVGVSAGSYIAAPTIEMAKWKHLDDPDVVKLTDLHALNLIPFLIVAHYGPQYKQAVKDGVQTTSLPVVVLTDYQEW